MAKLGIIIGSIIILHSAYSMIEHRKFQNEDFVDSVPLDIIVEVLLGMLINMVSGAFFFNDYMPIQEASILSKISYSEVHANTDLRPLNKTRTGLLKKYRKIATVKDLAKDNSRVNKLLKKVA